MTPYAWQAKEAAENGPLCKRALFWAPRCGKTLATVLSLAHAKASRVLVVSPTAFAEGWASIFEQETDYRVDRGFNHSTQKVMQHLKDWRPRHNPGDHRALVVTYGELWRPGLRDEIYKHWQPEALILDESHRCASPSSRQARRARLIAWKARWVRCLSGTPAPNTYGDLWGQLSCLDYEHWGKSYKTFREDWLVTEPIYGRIVGVRDEERLLREVREYASVIKREDAFGPDQWVTCELSVPLPKKARALYTKLAKEWIAEVQHEGKSALVRGDHTLRRLMKFQQITSGFVRSEDGVDYDLHRDKIEAVKDACGEIFRQGEKVVIFHRFDWEHHAYKDAFGKGVKVYAINGETHPQDRFNLARRFCEYQGPAVMVVQIQSASEAISLAEAQHVFFVSNTFGPDTQARDRIYKPGETRTVTYVRCPNTVDSYIRQVLAQKRSIHETVMQSSLEEMLGV